MVAPAGDTERHDFQYLWDIGIGKRFNLGGDVALQVDLQLFNVAQQQPHRLVGDDNAGRG